MEGLSAASGAFAVVSLAIQIGASLKRLCDFWESVQDGSKDIRIVANDLHIMSYIMEDIRDAGTRDMRPQNRAMSTTLAALRGCVESIETLQEVLNEHQTGFSSSKRSKKTWAAFRVAWNGDKLKRYQDILSRMKMTLILARQTSIDQLAVARADDQQLELATIAKGVKELIRYRSRSAIQELSGISTPSSTVDAQIEALRQECRRLSTTILNPVARLGFDKLIGLAILQISDTANATASDMEPPNFDVNQKEQMTLGDINPSRIDKSSTGTSQGLSLSSVFGKLHLEMTSSPRSNAEAKLDLGNHGHRISFQMISTFHPSQWLLLFGVNFGVQILLSQSIRGLDCRLTTHRTVPDDAMIFKLCEKGDMKEVRRLFDAGKASPFDTNSKGLTPLFLQIVARAGDSEGCRLLLSYGANINARSLNNESVESYACMNASGLLKQRRCVDQINSLRIFLEQFDFTNNINCTGLLGLRRLLFTSRCTHPSCSHGPNSPAAFIWALPLLKSLMDLKVTAIARGLAQLFSHAMMADDIYLLEMLMPVIGDINSMDFVRWFSPAHELVLSLWRFDIRESHRYLLDHGLDLHVTVEDDFTRNGLRLDLGGCHTPLSYSIRYSNTFFKFRKLLQATNINIEHFIDDDLDVLPGLGSNWAKQEILSLFSTSFCPFKMPLITCRVCHSEGLATEWSWLAATETLRTKDSKSAADVFAARDESLPYHRDVQGTTCYYCYMRRTIVRGHDFGDELEDLDSVFLMPL
ncbi:hypothetical protein VTL71DRAFT_13317 [Oculimacula yallundae]|uniref:Azaphilone pigments biosynthesis cluster protein L N-terminal domain-containing protein n=1 Tax=Oculimacula yallundae TaxID=86028 RepID=A0ABR4CM48_9HELO